MTALEAALAFADVKSHTDQWWGPAEEMAKHREWGESIWEAALRILAAQVRADADERAVLEKFKATADNVVDLPPEHQAIINDHFWELLDTMKQTR